MPHFIEYKLHLTESSSNKTRLKKITYCISIEKNESYLCSDVA